MSVSRLIKIAKDLNMLRLVCTLMLFYLPVQVFSMDRVIPITNIKEKIIKKINVSGKPLSGIMFNTLAKKIQLNNVYIWVGNKAKKFICVKMRSIDGTYEASFDYARQKGDIGKLKFDIKSKHRDYLSKYNPEQLVILASTKENCTEKDKKNNYIITAWGENITTSVVAYFMRNGDNVDVKLKIKQRSMKPKAFECELLNESKIVAYDTKCAFTIKKQYDLSSTIIKISKNGRPQKIAIPIYYEN